MGTFVYKFLWTYDLISFSYIPVSTIAGSLSMSFWGKTKLHIFFFISTNCVWGIPILQSFSNIFFCSILFYCSHSSNVVLFLFCFSSLLWLTILRLSFKYVWTLVIETYLLNSLHIFNWVVCCFTVLYF